jgi:hypothetical protein
MGVDEGDSCLRGCDMVGKWSSREVYWRRCDKGN